MIQHLAPDLVRDDELESAREGGVVGFPPEGSYHYGARTFFDAIDNSPNGVFGDQTDATAAKGERLFEAASDQLVRLATWVDEQPRAELMPHDHVS